MNIKKLTRLSFFLVIFLIISLSTMSIIIMFDIKHNNKIKGTISKVVLLQERMNEEVQSIEHATKHIQLENLHQTFNDYEKYFETLRKSIPLSGDFGFFNTLFKDESKQNTIIVDLKYLYENEHTIELAFASMKKLQERYINLSQDFETLYPKENKFRQQLESDIINIKDSEMVFLFGKLEYYSKETLYQYRNIEALNNWLSYFSQLAQIYPTVKLNKYEDTIREIGQVAINMKQIEDEKKSIQNELTQVIQQNKNLGMDITNSIESISEQGIERALWTLIFLTLSVIAFITIFSYKVTKNVALSVDEIEQKVKEGLFEIGKLNKEITDTQKEVVFTMGAIAEQRSKETGNHVKRVANYSKILALRYGFTKDEAEMLKQASPMHDIGKVAIPDAILNKPGRFDSDEREIMQTHAQLGYEMLKNSSRPLLKMAAIIAKEHHEKWDGSGYPEGLKGEEISIHGRITALADVFDALGSDRVYKKAWNNEKIFKLFKEEKGKHFDPQLIDIFFNNLDEFLQVQEKYKDE